MCPFTYKIELLGLVQGVGFRPFVYQLALKFRLFGVVYNDSRGVVIKLNASKDELECFLKALKQQKPDLARIDEVQISKINFQNFKDFHIQNSQEAPKTSPILSDMAICKACRREFYTPGNPRFCYPFITCTHCGVRFSILKKLPYDRENTTMSAFKMCEFCKNEYEDPLNSRFHAQPISCPKCAIKVHLKDNKGQILKEGDEAFKLASTLLKEGKILAIKGVGGFHLCCDGLNEVTIQTLRERKNRPKKPLALMCKDLIQAKTLAHISTKEAEILQSAFAPIVILRAKKRLEQIAPDIDKIGIMLAYTPFHLLLFEHFKNPIIATSANLSGESIIYKEDELFSKLGGVFDYVLGFDREIQNSSDDSITQVVNNKMMILRASRGLRPAFMPYESACKEQVLALGAELKNTFVIFYDKKLMISPYIGDLKSVVVRERLHEMIDFFRQNYDLNFTHFICDMHPNFSYVKDFSSNFFKVQHHFAHAVAVLFEHKITHKSALAFCFDGTGYGEDKSIWGGEILKVSVRDFTRLGHFRPFRLINAEITNIANLALSLIFELELEKEAASFLAQFESKKLSNLKKLHSLSTLKTSSLGRIIDAFGAVIFKKERLEYEAQIGLLMESYYDKKLDYAYKFELVGNEVCIKSAFLKALSDEPRKACTGFLNGLADFIIAYSNTHLKALNLDEIILCGGVFQNKSLLEILQRKGFKAKFSLKFPPNDSSIALGQMVHFLSRFEPL